MSCNSAIYTVNRTNTELGANSQIPFGGVVRRFGQGIRLEGGDIIFCQNGYYEINVSATLEPTAAGPVSAQLYLNGMPYLGAQATETAAAAGDAVNLSFPAIVRVMCGNASSMSLYLGDEGATPVNVVVTAKKL